MPCALPTGKERIPAQTPPLRGARRVRREVWDPQELGALPPQLKAPPSPPLGFPQIHPDYWQAGIPTLQPSPQPQHGKGSHQGCQELPVGGLSEASQLGRNSNRGVSGASSGRDRPVCIIHCTETLVPSCVHAGAQPFPGQYGEFRGVLPYPISAGGPTHPWPTLGTTRGPSRGEKCDPIGGWGGGSGPSRVPT